MHSPIIDISPKIKFQTFKFYSKNSFGSHITACTVVHSVYKNHTVNLVPVLAEYNVIHTDH